MAQHAVSTRVDPKQTERFLIEQENVLDASVWLTQGQMQASVVVSDEALVSSGALQLACLEHLGAHQTPHKLMLMKGRSPAA